MYKDKIKFTYKERYKLVLILVFPVATRQSEKFSDLSDLLSVPEFPTKDSELLPADETLPTIETPLPKHREKGYNGRSLVLVETHKELYNHLVRVLMPDYEAVSACDTETAFTATCGQHPDVVLASSALVGTPGEELVVRIKSDDKVAHVSVILLVEPGEDGKETQRNAGLYAAIPFAVSFLKAEIESLTTNQEIICKRYIYLTLGVDVSDDVKTDVPLLNGDQEFISLVRGLIEERLTDSRSTIDELNDRVNMNRSSFYNRIKEITGRTPADYVRGVCFDEALILLMNKKYTITKIADTAELSDPRYFRVVFEKHFGDSSTKYISNLQVSGRPVGGVPCRSSSY